MTISRRKFAQLLGAGAVAAVARPALSFAKETAPVPVAAAGVVRLSSNENPYGPSAKALKAMTDAFGLVNRYPDEQADLLVESLAQLNGVERGQILLGDGSGEILKLCADVFTGPLTNETKKPSGALVVADPTFEAILYHAKLAGAEIVKVPLTSGFAHDLPKMLGAAKKGVIYICNPNNPTASITPAKEIRDFIARAPNDTMIMVDEAYHHYADGPEYESMIPLVKEHPNLIVARTFSKIYGMAGLRCGYCVAQSYTVERLRERQSWDSTNTMALVAAGASLEDTELVSKGRALNTATRAFTTDELGRMGFESVPSQANFIMVDSETPGRADHPDAQEPQDPGRPIISRDAESFASHDWEKSGDGIVSRCLPRDYDAGLSPSPRADRFRRFSLTTAESGGLALQAGAEFGQPHFDRVAAHPFTGGFGLGQRLRLVGRASGAEAAFRKFVGRPGAAHIRLARVGVDFPEEEIAGREVGVNFNRGAIGRGSGRCFGAVFLKVHGS